MIMNENERLFHEMTILFELESFHFHIPSIHLYHWHPKAANFQRFIEILIKILKIF